MNAETLGLGRALLKLTIEHPPKPDGAPLRGYRRVTWIEQALQPLRSSLDERIFQRLVSGLAMVVGWEALIVLEDVRGLDHHDRTETSLWAAHALVKAALDEQAATDRR
jgi:hypothetical protein